MKRFILGPDHKPCIWPIPEQCFWNQEIYDLKGAESLHVSVQDEFLKEAELFVDMLEVHSSINAFISNRAAHVNIVKCSDQRLGSEGYKLDVVDTSITLQALTPEGISRGCQSLLQLIKNSPSDCIIGVNIIDKPVHSFRGVRVAWPARELMDKFERFIDFLAKYKVNKVIFEKDSSCESFSNEDIIHLEHKLKARHIEICPDVQLPCETVIISVSSLNHRIGSAGEIYEIIKMSCTAWRGGDISDSTVRGRLRLEALETTVAQLYPKERDQLNQKVYPSSLSKKYQVLEMREFYNAPLILQTWKPDGYEEYDFMYMEESKNIPNTVSFDLFQGVLDFKQQNALVLAENGRSPGSLSIPVQLKAQSLAFLHSYTTELTCIDSDSKVKESVVGYYIIHYIDGTRERVEIVYNQTITHWKTGTTSNHRPECANPVFKGETTNQLPYTIYSHEWVNPKSNIEISRIDVLTADHQEAGGIALFGMTAVN